MHPISLTHKLTEHFHHDFVIACRFIGWIVPVFLLRLFVTFLSFLFSAFISTVFVALGRGRGRGRWRVSWMATHLQKHWNVHVTDCCPRFIMFMRHISAKKNTYLNEHCNKLGFFSRHEICWDGYNHLQKVCVTDFYEFLLELSWN